MVKVKWRKSTSTFELPFLCEENQIKELKLKEIDLHMINNTNAINFYCAITKNKG